MRRKMRDEINQISKKMTSYYRVLAFIIYSKLNKYTSYSASSMHLLISVSFFIMYLEWRSCRASQTRFNSRKHKIC